MYFHLIQIVFLILPNHRVSFGLCIMHSLILNSYNSYLKILNLGAGIVTDLVMFVSVGNVAASRRRQHAITVAKERRESLVRAKRLCRVGIGGDDEVPLDSEMMIIEEQSILESQTTSAVEELKSAISYQ